MKHNLSKQIVSATLKGNGANIFVVIITLFAAALLSVVSPIIYKTLIDDVIPNGDIKRLVVYLILMITLPWLITLVSSLKNYFSTKIGENISSQLRLDCFDKVMHAKQEAFENITPPQILHRITRECGKIGEIYVTKDLATFVSEIISLLATLTTMLIFNVPLTCVCLVAFPLSFGLTKYVSKKNKALDAKLFACLEKGDKFLNEAFNKIKTIKLKNAYRFEENKWRIWLHEYRKIKLKTTITHSIHTFLLGNFIVNIIYGFMFFLSGLLVIRGKMTIGTLVSFVAFVPKVYSSLRNVLNIRITTSVIDNAFNAINEILELPQENRSGKKIDKITSLGFENVYFKYNRDDFGIEKMNFNIGQGKKIGIVGKSGGGKTTIIDLLTGLYYAQGGIVSVNENDICTIDLDSLRGRISVVTQDIELFEGNLEENITFNCEKSSCNIETMIEIVSLKDFIDKLPDGVHTRVGYNGELLSGGERQRIAIANALIKDSDVLILDEFTSALDLETEKKVMSYLLGIKDKIVIIISHRIYALMNCDEVYVISNGQIIERGKPTDLREKESFFAKMLNDMKYD